MLRVWDEDKIPDSQALDLGEVIIKVNTLTSGLGQNLLWHINPASSRHCSLFHAERCPAVPNFALCAHCLCQLPDRMPARNEEWLDSA